MWGINMDLWINIAPLLKRYDLATCTDIYKTAGFTAMDYPLFEMSADASVFNTPNYHAEAQKIRSIADAKQFRVNQTHAPFSYHTEKNGKIPSTTKNASSPASFEVLRYPAFWAQMW